MIFLKSAIMSSIVMGISVVLAEAGGLNEVWLALIAAGVLLGQVWFTKQEAQRTRIAAATEAELVRADNRLVAAELISVTAAQEAKQELIAKHAQDIHTLVNAQKGAYLKDRVETHKRLAELSKDPNDVASHEEAVHDYEEHEKQQALVNATAGEKARA